MKSKNTKYTEVNLDGQGLERNYRNPMTRQFQYEYALYMVISEMFKAVICRSSRCIETLELYFKELYFKELHYGNPSSVVERIDDPEKKRTTQWDIIEEMRALVKRTVPGRVTFPMMHICRVETFVITGDDGTHTFRFTDGIYDFSVHLRKLHRNGEIRIDVQDNAPVRHDNEGLATFKATKNAA